jgi:hypothetical protein
VSEAGARYELRLTPVPPDTAASVREDVMSVIEAALRDAGKEGFLAQKQMEVEVEETFPMDPITLIAITLLSNMAFETYKQVVLPALKRRFGVQEERKS